MELTFKTYLIVLPLVFLASLVDSIGGGGGLISLPAYTITGLPYGLASGCNKFSACFGALSATVRYFRSGRILWKPALWAAAAALPGAWFGTWVSNRLGNDFMHIFMVCAIPVVAALMLLKRNDAAQSRPMTRLRLMLCALSGLCVGFYDGFFGPGTGTFLILLFTGLTGMDMVTASATAKPVNLASNLASLVTRLLSGQVILALALPATVFSVAGAWIGTKLALTKGARFIRYVMLGVLALLLVKLAVELL